MDGSGLAMARRGGHSLADLDSVHPEKAARLSPGRSLDDPRRCPQPMEKYAYRFPPYQYKKEFSFRKIRNPRELRVASVEEREILMHLGRGYTKFVVNPVKAKADSIAWSAAPTTEDRTSGLILANSSARPFGQGGAWTPRDGCGIPYSLVASIGHST